MVKLIKPDVVSHCDKKKYRCVIYSIDFQPNSFRIATAGGDCTAKIWNSDYLLAKAEEPNTSNETDSMAFSSSGYQDGCLLATLDPQAGAINICRWSPDGTMLAIGDDRNIYIYAYSTSASAGHSFGSKHAANKENWVRKFLLQGHSMDIVDLSWSPSVHSSNTSNNADLLGGGSGPSDYLLLASGSIDNNIMLWKVPFKPPAATATTSSTSSGVAAGYNSSNILTPGQILKGHSSFVKGVSFDPIGRYLLSVSADNVLIVWENSKYSSLSGTGDHSAGSVGGATAGVQAVSNSTLAFLSSMNIAPRSGSAALGIGLGFGRNNTDATTAVNANATNSGVGEWFECARLLEPFKDSSDKTLSRRCDWAPDGSCVCLSNCVKSNKPIGNVLKRLQWSSVCDLVGHDASITCARFYQGLLCSSTSSNRSSNGPPVSVVAMGDQFGVLSVWNTDTKRAILICRDVFSSSSVGSNGTLGGAHSCGITDLSWRQRVVNEPDAGANAAGSNGKSVVAVPAAATKTTTTYVLSVASMDGSIAVIEFSAAELGTPCTADGLNQHYAKLYGISRSELVSNIRDCNHMHREFLKEAAVASAANPNSDAAAALGFGTMPSAPVAQHVNILTARSKSGYVKPLTTSRPVSSLPTTATTKLSGATTSSGGSGDSSNNSNNKNNNACTIANKMQIIGQTSNGKTRITPVLMNGNATNGSSGSGGNNNNGSNKISRLNDSSGAVTSSSSVHQFMNSSQVGFGGGGSNSTAGHAVTVVETIHTKLVQLSVLTVHIPRDVNAGIRCSIPYRLPQSNSSNSSSNNNASGIEGSSSSSDAKLQRLNTLCSGNGVINTDGGAAESELAVVLQCSDSTGFDETRTLLAAAAARSGGLKRMLNSNAPMNAGTVDSPVSTRFEVAVRYTTVPATENAGKPTHFSTLCCRKVSSSSTTTGGGHDRVCWSTAHLGHVTALVGTRSAAIAGGHSLGLLHNLCALGTLEGTIQLLSSITGLRVHLPVVVGAAVAHVALSSKRTAGAAAIGGGGGGGASVASSSSSYELLVVTVQGDIIVLDLAGRVDDPTALCVKQTVRTSMHPLLTSIHTACTGSNCAGDDHCNNKSADTVVNLLQCSFDTSTATGNSASLSQSRIVLHLSYNPNNADTDTDTGAIGTSSGTGTPVYVSYAFDCASGFWSQEESSAESQIFQLSKYFNQSYHTRFPLHVIGGVTTGGAGGVIGMLSSAAEVSNIALMMNGRDRQHEKEKEELKQQSHSNNSNISSERVLFSSSSTGSNNTNVTTNMDVYPGGIPIGALVPPINKSAAIRSGTITATAMQNFVQFASICQIEESMSQCVSKLSRLPRAHNNIDVNCRSTSGVGTSASVDSNGSVLLVAEQQITASMGLIRNAIMSKYIYWCKVWVQVCCQTAELIGRVDNLVSVLLAYSRQVGSRGEVEEEAEIFQFLSNATLLSEVVVPTLQNLSLVGNGNGKTVANGSDSVSTASDLQQLSAANNQIVSRMLQEISDCQNYWTSM